MTALVRYTFALALHSQRYLAPLLLFTGLMAVLTVSGSGPLPPAYASSAGALFVASTWLTVALFSLDAPPQRAVLAVSTGHPLRMLLGQVATVLLSCLLLSVLGLLFPLWVGSYDPGPADLALGAVAQLTGALTGCAIGVLCARPVFRRQGYALVAALALVMTALFVPGLPPVNRLLRLMATSSDSAALIPGTAALLASAAVLLALATTLAHAVATRRD
ncbi:MULTISPECIES: hypothetical protein [Streptomyces]|uniref:ABC transporter n=1 Tax=Streptomyces solicathayae TaxID=3081768 RepID=A0ABZ0LN30_9ACTN|nr:hypothetical protein [Streptomyces sp. HUAS YS2]WOX20899.1 hypothetical protein R2D22_05620 [Streptomyces sp. HUAS YS2]